MGAAEGEDAWEETKESVCASCGNVLSVGAAFCDMCGAACRSAGSTGKRKLSTEDGGAPAGKVVMTTGKALSIASVRTAEAAKVVDPTSLDGWKAMQDTLFGHLPRLPKPWI